MAVCTQDTNELWLRLMYYRWLCTRPRPTCTQNWSHLHQLYLCSTLSLSSSMRCISLTYVRTKHSLQYAGSRGSVLLTFSNETARFVQFHAKWCAVLFSNSFSSICTSAPLQFTAMRCYAPDPAGELTALPRTPDWILWISKEGKGRKRKRRRGKERERKKKWKGNWGQERRRGQRQGEEEWKGKRRKKEGKGGILCICGFSSRVSVIAGKPVRNGTDYIT